MASTVAPPVRAARRPRRAWTWRPLLRRVHKWTSLVLGLLLLIVVMSGVVVLLAPEIDQVTKPELYTSTPTETPVSMQTAIDNVNRAHPDWGGTTAIRNRGVLTVPDTDFLRYAHVDPGTGKVLGTRAPYNGIMGFFQNLHMCLLSCEGYSAYVPFLAHHIGLKWGFDGEELTVAGGLLALSGILLLFLCVTGLVLWWPGIKRFARGFKVRRGQGTYKRDYDLHKVIGMAAIPFLLMWAVTGTAFELRAVGDLYYKIMPGSAPAEPPVFESADRDAADIGQARAQQVALAAVGGGARVSSVTVPEKKDPKGYYDVWLSPGGVDPYAYGEWPGNIEVAVDRTDATHVAALYGDPEQVDQFTEKLWENWNFPLHAGSMVGWLPRTVWILFGLVPLLLAFTGITMMLYKRRKRKRKKVMAA